MSSSILYPNSQNIIELHQTTDPTSVKSVPHLISPSDRRKLLINYSKADSATIFQGMGTHYAFIYVGNPPQRVSVIIDTGSHYTAFPCAGCKCGEHMNTPFDPKLSNTSIIKTCYGIDRCHFQQSYSEGSSWNAFKVVDKVMLGGESPSSLSHQKTSPIDFEFGCQESETGLFRTQYVDGIMGLSARSDTFPYQLHSQRATATKAFSICFKNGGGSLTLGGVDPDIMKQESLTNPLNFTPLLKKNGGWYTVELLDILMYVPIKSAFNDNSSIQRKTVTLSTASISSNLRGSGSTSGKKMSIEEPAYKYNRGKGVVIDSGTTDTYLTKSIQHKFEKLFKLLTGLKYSNHPILLSGNQYDRLPIIVYRFRGISDNEYFDVEVNPNSYAEILPSSAVAQNNNKNKNKRFPTLERQSLTQTKVYSFRIYLNENSGCVLGANFMNNHYIIFDPDGGKIGIMSSACDKNDQPTATTSSSENLKDSNSYPMSSSGSNITSRRRMTLEEDESRSLLTMSNWKHIRSSLDVSMSNFSTPFNNQQVYNGSKHLKHTLISGANYVCCAKPLRSTFILNVLDLPSNSTSLDLRYYYFIFSLVILITQFRFLSFKCLLTRS